MDIILIIRILITATFLILAVFGPLAFFLMRRFIRQYGIAHGELSARVLLLEQHMKREEHPTP
jgi:hypothetical protein